METLLAFLVGALAASFYFMQRQKVDAAKVAGLEATLATKQLSQEELTASFRALSAEALQQNTQTFASLSAGPIRESLREVKDRLGELERQRASAHAGLTEQLRTLSQTQAQLQGETQNLVKALRSPIVRGRWGEIQLRRVVELAGMVEYCDFVQQESLHDGRLRPDLIVRLPNNKVVVVDSKAPLQGYLDAVEAKTEVERRAALADHARHVKTHLQQLSSKSYWQHAGATPEFVVLFLPGEMFFSAALEEDPSLIEFGVDKQVILATPTTLIALLRAVAYGWRQEKMAQNAADVCELGSQLHDRLLKLAEHFGEIKKSLDKSVESYNKASASFESRVMVSARKLKEMGVTATKELPTIEIIDRTTSPELEHSH